MKKNNIQKMPKASQAGNGTKPHVASSTVFLQDIAESKYCLDMRGNENWGKRLDALRKILKAAAPKSQRPDWMPAYSFAPFYYVIDGEWFEGTWQRFPPVNPLNVVL